MARPNNAGRIAAKVEGLREAIRAFQALPDVTQDAMRQATRVTVSEIARLARLNLQRNPSIQTRTLLNSIGWTVNERSGEGRVGIQRVSTRVANPAGGRAVRVKGVLIAGRNGSALRSQGARLLRPSKYGHLVEFGRSGRGTARPEPFMRPAVQAEQQPYLDRCRAAGRTVEQQMAARAAQVGTAARGARVL